jgi:hypothetical protein
MQSGVTLQTPGKGSPATDTENDKTFVQQLNYSEQSIDKAGTLAAEPKCTKNDGLDGGAHNSLIYKEFIDATYCHEEIFFGPDSIPDPIPNPDPILEPVEILHFFDARDNLDTDSLSCILIT